jgi:hypothetical protein
MQTDTQGSDTKSLHENTGSVHVFVKRGQAQVKVEFDSAQATGRAIKMKAGGSVEDGLYFSNGGKDQEVADDEVVELKNGMHFTLIPNGRVS